MQNITLTRNGDKLVVEIDLSKDFGPSASGKTLIVASTRGNPAVPGAPDTFIGLNCFRRVRGRSRRAEPEKAPAPTA